VSGLPALIRASVIFVIVCNVHSFFKKVGKRPPTDKRPTGQSPKMSRNDDSSPSTCM